MCDFIQYQFWPWLLKASWQAAIIVLLVLAAQYFVGRRGRPCWRHALWLVVVARLVLPATVPSPVSLFNFFTASSEAARVAESGAILAPQQKAIKASSQDGGGAAAVAALTRGGTVPVWLWLWAAGAIGMAVRLGTNHFRLHHSVTRQPVLIDASVLELLEDCKQRMGVRTPITVVETAEVDGPCLFGVLRPRLLLPPGFARGFSPDELRYVFLHEVGHVKRLDIPLGWLVAWLQVLHWFNPLVWLAFSRMRMDRELACDALALSHAQEQDKKPYGRTMLKLLENCGGSLRAPSLAGIAEDKKQMKERIIMIAKFHKSTGGFAVAAWLLTGLGLVTLTDAQTGDHSPSITAGKADAPPRIIATSPKIGSTGVNPGLAQITVTFDRDMEGGMSWVGSGPEWPKMRANATFGWLDKRTCVMPVTLRPGHFYRIGINSKVYRNFRGENGVPVTASAITFSTSGAPDNPPAPEIVGLAPPNGATDVSPAVTELRVTFSVPMQEGYSWVDPPPAPAGKRPYWTNDHKTCVYPVELQPGTQYDLSFNNSESFTNFHSDEGVLLAPASYNFRTRSER